MNSRGFTFVEVLITSMIIMLSVSGYAGLQGHFMRSDADLNLRHVAVQLGQEKLDDLRQFTRILASPGEQAFNDRADDLGGALLAGEVEVQLSAEQQNRHQFIRNWRVVDKYYIDTDNDGFSDSWAATGASNLPVPLPEHSGLKDVTVTISWLDRVGGSHSINLSTSIAPVKLAYSYQAKSESDNVKASP